MADCPFFVGLASLGRASIAEMESRNCEDTVHEKWVGEGLSRHSDADYIGELFFVDEGVCRGYVPLVQEFQLREREARVAIGG